MFSETAFIAPESVGVDYSSDIPRSASRSLLASDKRPRIYVYPLSERYHSAKKEHGHRSHSPYGLEIVLPKQLRESPYITTDPEQADFFFAPAHLYYMQDRESSTVIADLLQEMRAAGPWLDRRNGTDHMLNIVHDHGRCQDGQYRRHLRNIMLIEHWGKVTGLYAENPCKLFDHFATDCDMAIFWTNKRDRLTELQARARDNPQDAHVHEELEYALQEFTPCYIQGHDLLVPMTSNEGHDSSRFLNNSGRWRDNELSDRPGLVFFAGGINTTHRSDPMKPEMDAGYSFGVRQTFVKMYAGEPGYRVFWSMIPNYLEEMHASKFCLAPAGWGWGSRFKAAVTRGCIPIIVQEGIKMEWEDDIDIQQFAIRMPFWYMHRIPEFLAKYIKSGMADRMLANLRCVWRLFWWHRPHGRAFEMLMCVLRARVLGGRPEFRFDTCQLFCGDGRAVDLTEPFGV